MSTLENLYLAILFVDELTGGRHVSLFYWSDLANDFSVITILITSTLKQIIYRSMSINMSIFLIIVYGFLFGISNYFNIMIIT